MQTSAPGLRYVFVLSCEGGVGRHIALTAARAVQDPREADVVLAGVKSAGFTFTCK
jgi:hypothetical protein